MKTTPEQALQTLRNIVEVKPTQQKVDKGDLFGQGLIDRSEQYIERNKHNSKEVLFESWNKKYIDWEFTSNNKEYYWSTYESLYPMGSKKARESISTGVTRNLDNLQTNEEKEFFFRDNASKWPLWLTKDLEEYFLRNKRKIDSKELERARIAQRLEVDSFLNTLEYDLSPDVSIESHTADLLKAYELGYTTEISFEDGRISVPMEDMVVPVYTLPETELSLEDQFIILNDLTPLAKQHLQAPLAKSRDLVKKSERATITGLYQRLESPVISDEFKPSIIIDYAVTTDNPIEAINSAVIRLVTHESESGRLPYPGDSIKYGLDYIERILNVISERLDDGRITGS